MGLYEGRVVAFNMEGFYEPLKAQLRHFVDTGMLYEDSLKLIHFPETIEELEALL